MVVSFLAFIERNMFFYDLESKQSCVIVKNDIVFMQNLLTVAPKATAATGTAIPNSWPE